MSPWRSQQSDSYPTSELRTASLTRRFASTNGTSRVSGGLYEALGILEVVLRNALGTQLAAHHGTLAGNWYDDPLGVLSELAHEDIAAARPRVRKLRRPETTGRS